MLCEECKKRLASVYITKIINNQKTEKHLCEQCAREAGEMDFGWDMQFSVQDLLKGVFSHQPAAPCFQPQRGEACPACGMTYSDFSHSGKIGCAECYEAFERQLEPLIRRIHGANAHNGKIPKRSGGAASVRQRLESMRRELEGYICREEYEAAAKLRDEIRALEKELGEA